MSNQLADLIIELAEDVCARAAFEASPAQRLNYLGEAERSAILSGDDAQVIELAAHARRAGRVVGKILGGMQEDAPAPIVGKILGGAQEEPSPVVAKILGGSQEEPDETVAKILGGFDEGQAPRAKRA